MVVIHCNLPLASQLLYLRLDDISAMAPIRVRHPKGVSTIQIDLDNATVQDLQLEILGISEIAPSQQDCASPHIINRASCLAI